MEAETPPSARRVDGTPASRIRESGPPRRRTRDVATAAHCLPSGLSPSVQEFHLVNRPLAADGSRTVTAGSDFHRPRSALTSLVRAQCAMSISAGGRRPPCGLAHPPSTDPGSWPPVPAPGADSPPRPFPNRGHGPRPPRQRGHFIRRRPETATTADRGDPGTPEHIPPSPPPPPVRRGDAPEGPRPRPRHPDASATHAPEATAATRRGPTPPLPSVGQRDPGRGTPPTPGQPGRFSHRPPEGATYGAARGLAVWGPVSGGAGACRPFGEEGGRYPWAMLSSCSTAGRSAHRSPPGGAWSLSTAARASRSPASAAAWTMSLAA
ncbi:hypothetical protein CFP59_02034 [Streptomyces malaysiensis subsp. malaysiensis]|nr:hypothetical protein CFP59_02034 [Streptomyces sp. M56]